jgi:hypothetical protein
MNRSRVWDGFVFEWFADPSACPIARTLEFGMLDALKPGAWHLVDDRCRAAYRLMMRSHVRVTRACPSPAAPDRIYTLRNQFMHGGATWNSSVNRDQIRDCTHFMLKLVPVVIEIMMDHPKTLWGYPCYPVVDSAPLK